MSKYFQFLFFILLVTFIDIQLNAKENKITQHKSNNSRKLRVASASPNQTVYNYAENVNNICEAIKEATNDHADILSLPELSLTGYAADDYHQWNQDNQTVWRHLKYIALFAKKMNPSLIISIGAPWHYSDKNLLADDPLYNINNRPYNTQITMTNGKIIGISAKSILADGPSEYEPRHFNPWPLSKATINVTLPDGSEVPMGMPVLYFGDKYFQFNIYHEQCAEAWPGISDNMSINSKEQAEARYVAKLSKSNDISIIINPSSSRPQPALNKEKLRIHALSNMGTSHASLYIYTNTLGSESGIYANDGSQIFSQNGALLHHGNRYSFKKVSYSSVTVEIPTCNSRDIHQLTNHTFNENISLPIGKEAEFEINSEQELKHEEYMRSIALWLRDYLSKQNWGPQGYLISLSGGADSAYGALAVTSMIELGVKEEGVIGFLNHFPKLKYKNEALEVLKKEGEINAISFIKKKMLTCIYLATENSSSTTLEAARKLIEGGQLPNGIDAKGIGGTFTVHNVQKSLDEYILSHVSFNLSQAINDAEKNSSWWESSKIKFVKTASKILSLNGMYESWVEDRIKKEINKYINSSPNSHTILPKYISDNCLRPIPSWQFQHDNLTLQNYQARARLVIPWAISNQESKIPLVTSNASEAALGYTTAGGDMHMGGANPIGGLPKSSLRSSLLYFQNHGLSGLANVPILQFITSQQPTAELKRVEDSTQQQTDEGDLGFTYSQSESMERTILTQRKSLLSAYNEFLKNPDFPSDPVELRNILVQFLGRRWPAAQFKRIMGTLSPYLGDNFDPHASLRTTVLGDHFDTAIAELTVQILADNLGDEKSFIDIFGANIGEVKGVTERNLKLKQLVISSEFRELRLNREDLKTSAFARDIRAEIIKLKEI